MKWNRDGDRRKALILVVAAGFGFLGAPGGPSLRAQAPLPDEVNQALARSVGGLDPVTLEWKRERSSAGSPAQLFRHMGWPDDPEFFMPVQVRHSLQDGMAYAFVRMRHQLEPKIVRGKDVSEFEQELGFDGTNYYSGDGVEGNRKRGYMAGLGVRSLQKLIEKEPTKNLMAPAYLYYYELGYKLPLTPAEYLHEPRPQSLVRWLIDKGAEVTGVRPADLEGVSCLLVELRGSDALAQHFAHQWTHLNRKACAFRFYLDPTKGYAVLRREELSDRGQLATRTDGKDFVRLPSSDTWLPRQCTVNYYTYLQSKVIDSPLFTESFSLTRYDRAPLAREKFSVSYDHAPGSIISTDSIPGREPLDEKISYQVPADPAYMDLAIQAALERQKFVPPQRRQWVLTVVLANVVLVALGAYVYWRRKARRPAQAQS